MRNRLLSSIRTKIVDKIIMKKRTINIKSRTKNEREKYRKYKIVHEKRTKNSAENASTLDKAQKKECQQRRTKEQMPAQTTTHKSNKRKVSATFGSVGRTYQGWLNPPFGLFSRAAESYSYYAAKPTKTTRFGLIVVACGGSRAQ